MHPAFERFLREQRSSGRAVRLLCAIAVHILAVFLAYFLSPPLTVKKPPPDLEVVMLPSVQGEKTAHQRASHKQAAQRTVELPKAPKMPDIAPKSPLNMMEVSSDISQATRTDADKIVGTGPNGEKFYKAEFIRDLTPAQMAPYFKTTPLTGWGEIYCKTAPNYRVDDCHELAESQDSGFARAMRLSSPKYLIRPPRRNGEAMIGVWLLIHIDFVAPENLPD